MRQASCLDIPGIAHQWLNVGDGVQLHYVDGGDPNADPLVLLHGFPESWVMWRRMLPALIERYYVVAPDLRGYGDSSKLAGMDGYDKGTMASDIHALVHHLYLQRILLIGHDRGARVARRYALEYPGDLAGVALLDILPEEYIYDRLTAAEVTRRYWHWIFNLIPALPEQLIIGKEEAYLAALFGRDAGFLEQLRADGIWDEYVRAFCQPGAVVAALNDYRATFNIDVPRYQAERVVGQRIDVPVMLLWGKKGNLGGLPVLDIWREVAAMLQGVELAGCGHYLPEEQPEIVVKHLLRFTAECFSMRS
jgi:haloacetate dehalogenase